MDTDDAWLIKLVAKRVGCYLREHRDAGTVVSVGWAWVSLKNDL